MRFIIVSGLSGAGKSLAIRYLEDMGFFCIDNLPPMLMPKFAELCYQSEGKVDKIAIVMDIRGRGFFDQVFESLDTMKESGYSYEIIFLDADDKTLISRYKESRRVHPLVKEGRIIQGINEERERLNKLRKNATHIIDTSNLKPKQLGEVIESLVNEEDKKKGLIVSVISFGFKHGMLLDADLVFDVRFLPNPFYIEELKEHSGREAVVKDYLFMFPETQNFLNKLEDMLEFLIPYYIREGKKQLVIGIGCTGGMHRSVAVAEAVHQMMNKQGHHTIIGHRDIKKNLKEE